MALEADSIVNNRYRIISQLSQGGFGAIYRAEDLNLKTICALKENLDYWDEAIRQFKQEALLLASLRHPNLPRVSDYFSIPTQGQYLVMDFVEGYDLQEVIERVGQPLVVKQVLAWIDQISDALIYLHSQRPPIIHRDVKPANIRLTPTGKAMLVDFGVAKRYSPDIKTTEGARAVTPGYSPIEQYGQSKTDLRTDIYSLGATLYTLLTANRPPESIDLITGKPLASPRQLNPAISPALERVILRAMELNAVNRYETVAQLRQSLKDAALISTAVAGAPGGGSTGRITRPLGQPASRPASVRPRQPSYKTAAKIDWITIPAGEFQFGEDRQRITLPEFQIARYPVTNEQYHYFLLGNPQHPPPPGWRGRDFPIGKARHPVVNVSHADVIAFCTWLSCRLPTAEEWEKAARGPDGRTYPWGEAWEDGRYCNNYEARNNGATPVDRYPEGVSPYKVYDMSGNVWEWTSTHHGSAWMNQLCGGSWRSYSGFAVRAATRDRLLLDDRRDDLGFRCARSV